MEILKQVICAGSIKRIASLRYTKRWTNGGSASVQESKECGIRSQVLIRTRQDVQCREGCLMEALTTLGAPETP
eukprot:1314412-Amphidinium_carterae.1